MAVDDYQHHDELLEALVNAIWRLVRSKPDLLDFFRGCGTDETILRPYRQRLARDRDAFKMPRVAREILQDLNADFDGNLRVRREIVKRIAQRDNFDTCYPDKRDEAELNVRRVRDIVERADSFTRMRQEEEKLRADQRKRKQEEQDKREASNRVRDDVVRRLKNLSSCDDPHQRGRDFESALNDLFRQQAIAILDEFKLMDDGVVTEQIDGVVLASGMNLLVEVKWHHKPLGNDSVGQHFMRLNQRANSHALFIARHGFTKPAIDGIQKTLGQHTTICADWHEIIYALEKNYPLETWIQRKTAAAVAQRDPYFRLGVEFQPDVV